jgi:hypothetical protein
MVRRRAHVSLEIVLNNEGYCAAMGARLLRNHDSAMTAIRIAGSRNLFCSSQS